LLLELPAVDRLEGLVEKIPGRIAAQQGMLKLGDLPPYSPEFYPDESAWNIIKGQVSGANLVENEKALQNLVRRAICSRTCRA
jgi:hypothetical protein